MSNPYGRAHATHRDAWDDGHYAGRLEGVKAGLEAAAKAAQDYDGDGVSKSGQYTQLGDGSRTRADISEAIRAIDPERIAEDK